LALVKCLH